MIISTDLLKVEIQRPDTSGSQKNWKLRLHPHHSRSFKPERDSSPSGPLRVNLEDDFEILNQPEINALMEAIEYFFQGKTPVLPEFLLPAGTGFQEKIWQFLQTIPFGKTLSYGEVAKQAGFPGAAQAVGNACGANPLPLLIPCHRVIGAHDLGGYAFDLKIKEHLLLWEKSFNGSHKE
jgi:methylated-DNA-[protein]-cysteine S-methyltransferase